MFIPKNQDPSIWNKKAKQYNRFSHDSTTFQHTILSKIAQRGIDFKGKTVLDIGCGTGVYTLHIAKDAKHVTALDFSQEMLDILQEDAIQEGLEPKFTFTCNTWSDFQATTPLDILFSSMSPAFKSDADFEKMHLLAKEHCVYLGWGGRRESTLLDPLFQAHGETLNVPAGAEKLRSWLDRHTISYTTEYIEELRHHTKPYDDARESALWHFEINGVSADASIIDALLPTMQDANGMVAFKTIIGVELISWAK